MAGTLAALDLGTNSFHLVVARFAGDGAQFEVIERQKEMVRLGSGGNGSTDMRVIEPDAIERGIAAVRRCRLLAEAHGAPLHAVATSAVREADNGAEFLARAREETGVDVQVITGTEEARLIHLGVLQALPVFDKRLLLVDIGGGSTEVLVGERGEELATASFKVGAIRMTRRFFRTDRLHPSAVDSCRRHIRAELAPIRPAVHRLGFDVAVGSSGTIAAVASMAHAAREPDGSAPRTWNGFEITRKQVRGVVKRLVKADTVDERRRLPGLDEGRADIILAGALVLEEAMAELDIERITLSDYALREGVLLDAWQRGPGIRRHHLHELRRRSVDHLAGIMDDDPGHSAQAARLALALFDGTRGLHGLGDDARELLEAAALLANVGKFVSHDRHHKHSYYVIRNTDQLTGFNNHEIELVAAMARYHRKSRPKGGHPEWAALRDEDRDCVWTCAVFLRLAFALDRSRSAQVEGLGIESRTGPEGEDEIVVLVEHAPHADLSLELYSAGTHTDEVSEVLGVPVTVEPVAHGRVSSASAPARLATWWSTWRAGTR